MEYAPLKRWSYMAIFSRKIIWWTRGSGWFSMVFPHQFCSKSLVHRSTCGMAMLHGRSYGGRYNPWLVFKYQDIRKSCLFWQICNLLFCHELLTEHHTWYRRTKMLWTPPHVWGIVRFAEKQCLTETSLDIQYQLVSINEVCTLRLWKSS